MIVDIDNRQNDLKITDEILKVLKESCEKALEVENYSKDVEISISLVSEEEIREINKEYRGLDCVTDVLSFPAEDDFDEEFEMLGDIILCTKVALGQKDEFSHSIIRELSYLTVHSMFHLLGYDHLTEEDHRLMREKEKRTMDLLGIYKSKKKIGKNPNMIVSFSYAVDGILHAFRNEKNFRFHIFMTIVVLLVSLLFDFSRVEMALLSITVAFVIFAEIINTAIENIVDLIYEKYNPFAKIAKDVAAGAVLVSAFNAIFVAYFLFFDRLIPLHHNVIFKLQNSPVHLTFIALVLVILVTIIVKSIFYKEGKNYLQGGRLSGHSALAFCAAMIISFLASSPLITALSMFLAFLVAESRIEGKIHTLSEVIIGGLTGIAIAILIFQMIL